MGRGIGLLLRRRRGSDGVVEVGFAEGCYSERGWERCLPDVVATMTYEDSGDEPICQSPPRLEFQHRCSIPEGPELQAYSLEATYRSYRLLLKTIIEALSNLAG